MKSASKKKEKEDSSSNSQLINTILEHFKKLIDSNKKLFKQSKEEYYIKSSLKGYLKKDINNIFSFIDKDSSIKVYFEKNTDPKNIDKKKLENIQITLKKFSFDFAIYQKDNKIYQKVILKVKEFEPNYNTTKKFDEIPLNVNEISKIKDMSDEVLDKILKEIINNYISDNSNNNKISANNFIKNSYKKFSENKNNKEIFSIILESLNLKSDINGNQFLLLNEKEFVEQGYIYNDFDHQINFELKKIDWKKLFIHFNNNNKKSFTPDKTNLNTMIEKISYKNLNPSEINTKIEINEKSKKLFLEKKRKRCKFDINAYKGKVPDKIIELMKNYGDILSNVSKMDCEKFKKFKKYSVEV